MNSGDWNNVCKWKAHNCGIQTLKDVVGEPVIQSCDSDSGFKHSLPIWQRAISSESLCGETPRTIWRWVKSFIAVPVGPTFHGPHNPMVRCTNQCTQHVQGTVMVMFWMGYRLPYDWPRLVVPPKIWEWPINCQAAIAFRLFLPNLPTLRIWLMCNASLLGDL